MQIGRSASPVAAGGLMLVGAVASVTSIFLQWFEVEWRGEFLSLQGIDGSAGGLIIFGVLVAAFAIVMLARARKKGGRAWSIAALVSATFVFVFAAFAALAPEAILPSFVSKAVSESLNISERFAQSQVAEAIRTGELNATSGIGAYLAFVGGALSVAGGIIGIVLARRFRRVLQPTGPALDDIVPLTGEDLPPPPVHPLDQREHGTLDSET